MDALLGLARSALRPGVLMVATVAIGIAIGYRSPAVRTAASQQITRPTQIAPQAVVVRARREEDLDRVSAFAAAAGFAVTGRIRELKAVSVEVPDGMTAVQAVKAFTSKPGVLYAEPDYPLHRDDVPADPLYAKESPYLATVHAPEAWDIEQGKPGVLVAVLDSGIDPSHPDLQGRIWTNPLEIPGNGIDDDKNGCVDDVHGCAFVDEPSSGCEKSLGGNVADDLGHGTFVAGIIAATGGNSQGMVGVARGVTILPVKVLDCQGTGHVLALAQGMLYAAEVGARVLNVSLSGPADSLIMHEAARIAHDDYGALIVAAAGNTAASGVSYPARYPEVLAVGAAETSGDKRAPFSTSGPEVDVVAIGQGIVGTVPIAACGRFLPCLPSGPYALGDGTSFAAPQVTGLVALMLSHAPNLTANAILSIIKATADALPAGDRPDWAGSGRINMLKALKPQFRLGVPGVSRD